MARLPRANRELALTPQIQSLVSRSDIEAPFRDLAGALSAIGASIGNYEDGVAEGLAAREIDQARTDALKLYGEANGNAEIFTNAWQLRSQERLADMPMSQRSRVEQAFIGIGGQMERQIISGRMDRDRNVAINAIAARQEAILGEMGELARNGQSGSEDYTRLHEELTGIVNARVSNPWFNVSPEQAELDLTRIEDTLVGAGVTGELERIYAKDGFQAAQRRAQEILDDESTGLPKAKRLKAIQEGLRSVRSLFQADTQSRTEFRAYRAEVVAGLADGSIDPNDPLVDDMIVTANAINDPFSRSSLISARAKARLNPMKSMSLPEQLDFLQSGVAFGSQAPGGAADLIRAEEGFRTGAYYDVNGYRTGFGSDTVTRADGRIERVTKDTVVTRADAERDLSRRIGQFAASVAAEVGETAWNGLPANVRSALVSVTYNYGNLPNSVAAAARSGDVEAIAAAVEKLSANPARRAREAAVIRGRGIPAGGPVFPKGVIPEVRTEIKDGLTTALGNAAFMLSHDVPVDANQIADMVEAARIVDDADTYQKVAEVIQQSDALAVTLGLPLTDHQRLLDQLSAPATAGDEFLRLKALDQANSTHDRMVEKLGTDPIGLGIEMGRFAPGPAIDWTRLDDAAAILSTVRAPMARQMASEWQTAPLTLLRPDEAAALSRQWSTSSVDDKVRLLGMLNQALPREALMATLAGFAGKDDTRMLAIAGALTADNPEAGAAVVRGQAALAENTKFGPPDDSAFAEVRDEVFPSNIVPPTHIAGWQAHLDAAKAIYADKARADGDTKGKFNPDRWKAALGMVTGGVLEFNGEKLIAPVYGMDQSAFDDLTAQLSNGVFIAATDALGHRITADMVRRNGRLVSVGDGLYAVEIAGGSLLTDPRALMAPIPSDVEIAFKLDLGRFAREGIPPELQAPPETVWDKLWLYRDSQGRKWPDWGTSDEPAAAPSDNVPTNDLEALREIGRKMNEFPVGSPEREGIRQEYRLLLDRMRRNAP